MWYPSLHKLILQRQQSYTVSFLICSMQCNLHLFPFFEFIWTFSWLFSFAAVTGPMHSGASALLFLNENPAINPIAISSKVKMSILLFGLPCWSLTIKNVGIHYASIHKIPEDVLPCFDWEAANIIFHAHLIMMIYIIHVSVVQLNVLWLIYLDHITTQSPVCVNKHFFWFEFVLTSLTILLSCQTVATKFEMPTWYDL